MARDRLGELQQPQGQSPPAQAYELQHTSAQQPSPSAAYTANYTTSYAPSAVSSPPAQPTATYQPVPNGLNKTTETLGRSQYDSAIDGGFLRMRDQVQTDIETVRRNIQQMRGLMGSIVSSVRAEETSNLQNQLTAIQDHSTSVLRNARNTLQTMVQQTKQLPPSQAVDASSRRVQQANLAQKLQQLSADFQAVQSDYEKRLKSRMAREVKIVAPNATQEEIDQAIDSRQGPVFAQQLLSTRVDAQRRTLQDVSSRHEELQRIERSITELYELFQEMQLMIDTQAEVINNVETRVGEATGFLEEGNMAMTKAVESRKSARRKAWIITGIIIVVIIILLVILWFTVISKFVNTNKA
ncbi:t-SNARE [Cladochytrium replicatum]|nr:t-SNARE [Cladochytrium replicatum]